jgi:thioredoxin 1
MAISLTESNFSSEVLESSVPVLVDFWAEWCGPCKAIGPIIDQLADEMAGQAKVGKLNVSNAPKLTAQYNVRSIPTLLFFQNGEVRDMIVGGPINKEQLKAKLLAMA